MALLAPSQEMCGAAHRKGAYPVCRWCSPNGKNSRFAMPGPLPIDSAPSRPTKPLPPRAAPSSFPWRPADLTSKRPIGSRLNHSLRPAALPPPPYGPPLLSLLSREISLTRVALGFASPLLSALPTPRPYLALPPLPSPPRRFSSPPFRIWNGSMGGSRGYGKSPCVSGASFCTSPCHMAVRFRMPITSSLEGLAVLMSVVRQENGDKPHLHFFFSFFFFICNSPHSRPLDFLPTHLPVVACGRYASTVHYARARLCPPRCSTLSGEG